MPAAERHVPVEHVADVAGADDLRGIALRRVRRPDVQVVAELRRQEPAGERQEELVQLDVFAPLHGLHVAERIRVGLVEPLLIEVAGVAEEADVHLALVALDDQESGIRDVARGFLRGLRRHSLDRPGPDDEVGHATVRDPDALVVVAPGLSEQARGLTRRPREDDAPGRVGRALLPLADLRTARDDDGTRPHGRLTGLLGRRCGRRPAGGLRLGGSGERDDHARCRRSIG